MASSTHEQTLQQANSAKLAYLLNMYFTSTFVPIMNVLLKPTQMYNQPRPQAVSMMQNLRQNCPAAISLHLDPQFVHAVGSSMFPGELHALDLA